MKKRLLTIGLCCVVFLTGCGNSSGTDSKKTTVSQTNISTQDGTGAETATGSIGGALAGTTLKIGCDTSFVPFCYPDDNNQYIGFDIDMLEAFSEKLGFEYELAPMDFTTLLMSVQTNKLDVGAAGITIKPERQEVMDFSKPYYDAGLVVMVNENNTDIESVNDLDGKTVALKEGTSSVDYLEEHVPGANLVTFPNIENAYLEVERGAKEAAVYDSPNILFYLQQNQDSRCKVVGEMFDGAQYGYVFQKGSSYTEYFDKALEEFKADGTYDKIYSKWFGEQK